MAATNHTVPYQFSVRTSKEAGSVLDEVGARGLAGIGVAERGSSYVVLRPIPRYRYSSDAAIGIGLGILIVTLLLTAVTPVFIVLLPLALTPALPFYMAKHRPMLAVSALLDEDGTATRVTVHGQAGPELAAALDAYLGALPAALPAPEPAEATEQAGPAAGVPSTDTAPATQS